VERHDLGSEEMRTPVGGLGCDGRRERMDEDGLDLGTRTSRISLFLAAWSLNSEPHAG
jgi:hypothetical protein